MNCTTVPAAIMQAAISLLEPYCTGLTETELQQCLSNRQTTQAQPQQPCRPFTRKAAADLLDVSLNTLNRYLNEGKLQRIYLSNHTVRVDADSVMSLLSTREKK